MKYNLFDGHQPKPTPHYCPHYSRQTRAFGFFLLALVGAMFAAIIIFHRHLGPVWDFIDTHPLLMAAAVWAAFALLGVWWLISFIRKNLNN